MIRSRILAAVQVLPISESRCLKSIRSPLPVGMTLDSGRLSLRAAELLPQGVATPDTAWALDSGKLSVSQKDGSDTVSASACFSFGI